MKKELQEILEIDEKLAVNTNLIDSGVEDINIVKTLKNNIYQKASKVFVYNLKKLIQLETTQKKLARKIGISEDLLSKYKSGEAFPTIETLIYICKVYNLNLNSFLNIPLDSMDLERIESLEGSITNSFEKRYYVYFLVTNSRKEGALHEGIVEIEDKKVDFKILSEETVVKQFYGTYTNSDKLVFFNLKSKSDGVVNINMIKPNLNKSKYVGGVSMLLLSSDANSKPCSQKMIFSKVRLDRRLYNEKLHELLNFNLDGKNFGHVKVTQIEDESAYNFIESLL